MKKNPQFIHLRNISSYSLSYGQIQVAELVDLAVQHKMPAISLADKNNFFGLLEFALAAVKKGVQPIIAVALTVQLSEKEQDQILLIAKNEVGYHNLMRIVSNSYLNDNTDLGIATFSDIEKYNDGVISLIGYYKGKLFNLLKDSQLDKSKELIEKYQEIYHEDLYLEIARLGEDGESAVNPKLLKLAIEHNLPIVATNDVKYKDANLHEAQDILSCIAATQYFDDNNREKSSVEHYFKSPLAMARLFKDLPEAIENTENIAKKCSFFPTASEPSLPKFPCEGGRTEEEELRFQGEEGLVERIKQHNVPQEEHQKYQDRLDYELGIIEKMGFPGYFLIVSDFIKWSKDNNIPVGPGRGSGAGSIVAWVLKITDLDPIRFGLLFERFLNPERVSMPDFDIDFCQERRGEVILYVQKKYGKARLAQIITFGKLQARAVLKDVGRVLQMPYGQVDRICKMIPFSPLDPVTLSMAIEMDPELKKAQKEDPQIARLLNISLKLEGLHRHASTHAAGVVIGNQDLIETIPLYKDPKSELPVVSYSMKYTELAGLVKFDFLGLKTLTVIAKAVEILKQDNIDIDIENLPLEDEEVFKMLSTGESIGVFQLESAGMRDVLKKMQPDRIEELIALISLYRPGPMENIPQYVAVKHKKEVASYPHPMITDCLEETFGVIIYQEQVMQIAQIMGGYSLGQADLLRRAMGKKIKSEMDAQRDIFVEGALKKDITKKKAEEVFELLAKFAGYGFNKSHAAAYALIGYQTAYLKAHYPAEFITATLNLEYNDTDKVNLFISEAKKMDIPILAPSINESVSLFKIEKTAEGKKGIRYGLAALKSVGSAITDNVVEIRKDEKFKDICDFISRCGSKIIQKRQLESFIRSGSLDDFGENRASLLASFELLLKYANQCEQEKASKQTSLFGDDAEFSRIEIKKIAEFSAKEQAQQEFEAIGFYLENHPIEQFEILLEKENITCSNEIEEIKAETQDIRIAGAIISYKQRSGKNGRFVTLNISDKNGIIDLSIFNEDLINEVRELLVNGTVVVVEATLKQDESGSRIMINSMVSLEEFLAGKHKGLEITVKSVDELLEIGNRIKKEKGDLPLKIKFILEQDGKQIFMDAGEMVMASEGVYREFGE